MDSFGFHPIVAGWFCSRFNSPTEPQRQGWPLIAGGHHTLIAAPTGSGKTLTAFLACIDRLVQLAIDNRLGDETQVVYVSPLRALSNDMHRNLEWPLQEIRDHACQLGQALPELRIGLRTGDTPPSRRAALVRRPPHILVTTPESLYLMLTSQRGRESLRNANTLIVDEIHALVRDKRGSHLALTMERLEALAGRRLQRIGLSATQRPIERVARFLVGTRSRGPSPDALVGDAAADCQIVDVGHRRQIDLAIEIPQSELGAVCTHEQWAEVNQRLVELIRGHRSTLLFVNTRRMAERVTHQLTELLGEDAVGSHHGSLSAKIRLDTERRLKAGQLKAVVATASLELGIDVGYIDLVIQLGSPRSIAALLQRIGRSGHALDLTPKGRLFALSRDGLLEAMALTRAVASGCLDSVRIPEGPLDILAQQLVAEVAGQDWDIEQLFNRFRMAWPFRHLSRNNLDRTLEYLSEGISHVRGRSRALVHWDRVQGRVRGRKGARIVATSNGGAIPEIASYRVVTNDEGTVVGSLDEDFAIESNRGDIFLLGNTSWRIVHVRGGDVTVVDAQGAPPTVPFWRGEAPGRSLELSAEVARIRSDIQSRLDQPAADVVSWLAAETGCSSPAAGQAYQYVAAQHAAVGLVPNQEQVVFERFFDETGGMQLVVHAPFGADINRAWALAMRKRFCRSFDFELQATADDNGFILSLGPQHSFPIESLFPMLRRDNARNLLEQAVLTHPMFLMRWRWNVTRALQVDRLRNGKKVPPALQRFRADDLLTAVFPKLTGCQEEHSGDHIIPDHPLLQQTMHDCLHEPMDLPGLYRVLDQIAAGEITLIARDTREPSPFSYELLNANVYAFLDGGEIQERRARAVASRRSLTVESVQDLGRLDPRAIEQVRIEAQPSVRDADELHDLLLSRILLPVAQLDASWQPWLERLVSDGRATMLWDAAGPRGWVAAERLPAALAVLPNAECRPQLTVPSGVRHEWSAADARVAMVRGLVEICGPTTTCRLASELGITPDQALAAMEVLEADGTVLRGHFDPATDLLHPPACGRVGNEQREFPRSESGARGQELCISPAPAALDPPKGPKGRVTNSVETCKDKDALEGSRAIDPKLGGDAEVQWCHRRLLSRIHRLTMQGLRREIEPVDVATYLRFLQRHQGLIGSARRRGVNGVFDALAMLQGLDIPAVCWERDILPLRVEAYQASWLDELCLNGEIGWGRLYVPARDDQRSRPLAALTRNAPVSLWLRSDLEWLLTYAPREESDQGLSGAAAEVRDLLSQRGALFASELLSGSRLLPAQLDEVLGELITRGLVSSDGFAGLRKLIQERSPARASGRRRRLQRSRDAAPSAGRWSLWRPSVAGESQREEPLLDSTVADQDAAAQWAWQLLRRWGVVFRDLLSREPGAPSWYMLLRVYRRLEARGEIRGGRFVQGVGGEQFATAEAVRLLRAARDEEAKDEVLVVCGADPLNLVGVITQHARVPATATNRVAFHHGVPVAALQGGQIVQLTDVPIRVALNAEAALTQPYSKPAAEAEREPDARDRSSSRRTRRPGGIPKPLV